MHPTTNGYGAATIARMRKLLAEHEHVADALRTVLGLLDGAAAKASNTGTRGATVLARALAMERARVESRTSGPPKKKSHKTRAQKAQTAAKLAVFSKTPQSLAELKKRGLKNTRIGTLARFGYIDKTTDGRWVRTDKVYEG